MKIEVIQSEHSELWYWRVYDKAPAGMEQVPLVASNGYAAETECRKNLELVRQAFFEGVTA